jgi:hypothetical protein
MATKNTLSCRRHTWAHVEADAAKANESAATFWPIALPWARQVHAKLPELFVSFMMAQWAEETAYGGFDWTTAHNPGNVGSFDGRPVNMFPNLQEGIDAYIQTITNGLYGGCLAAKSPDAQCFGIGNSPWASARYEAAGPPPGEDLVKIIAANNLTQYDGPAPPVPTPVPIPAPQPPQIIKPISGKVGMLNAPIVAGCRTPSGNGYIEVGADGGTFNYGDAPFLGSLASIKLNAPIVDAAITPTGRGLTLVATDGGVFDLGDSLFEGSEGGHKLNAPVIAIALTTSGKGYWLYAADGGVFAFGDAPFLGSAA